MHARKKHSSLADLSTSGDDGTWRLATSEDQQLRLTWAYVQSIAYRSFLVIYSFGITPVWRGQPLQNRSISPSWI